MYNSKHDNSKKPPSKSKNLITDVIYFLLDKPKQATLINFGSAKQRTNYNFRVMQRTGIDPNRFSILNIHQIGIEAPASYVFNELLQWNGDSSCWPNYIAKVDRIEDDLKNIQILPLGMKKYPFKFMKSFFGFKLIPLFLLHAIRIKNIPDTFDFDNARYLLYECTGGYPIGIFSMYTRSSIPELGEINQSQLFFVVGFNFYGKKNWQEKRKLVNNIWEGAHNRVTSNVLNRIKQLSEWRFDTIQNK